MTSPIVYPTHNLINVVCVLCLCGGVVSGSKTRCMRFFQQRCASLLQEAVVVGDACQQGYAHTSPLVGRSRVIAMARPQYKIQEDSSHFVKDNNAEEGWVVLCGLGDFVYHVGVGVVDSHWSCRSNDMTRTPSYMPRTTIGTKEECKHQLRQPPISTRCLCVCGFGKMLLAATKQQQQQ